MKNYLAKPTLLLQVIALRKAEAAEVFARCMGLIFVWLVRRWMMCHALRSNMRVSPRFKERVRIRMKAVDSGPTSVIYSNADRVANHARVNYR